MLGGGTAREEGGRARADGQAVGEDQPRAGIEGRHAVSQARGADRVARAAALQPGRLRMHDLYRQQRAGRGGDRRRDQAGQPGRVRDSERQSQFRGAHQSGRALQLPRVAAAGGRIRDRRHDGFRRRASAARHRLRRAGRSFCATSGRRRRKSRRRSTGSIHAAMFKSEYGQVFDGDERWQSLAGARGQPVPLGGGFAVREGAAVFRRRDGEGRRRSATSAARARWRCSATASRPITFRRPARSRPTVRRENI